MRADTKAKIKPLAEALWLKWKKETFIFTKMEIEKVSKETGINLGQHSIRNYVQHIEAAYLKVVAENKTASSLEGKVITIDGQDYILNGVKREEPTAKVEPLKSTPGPQPLFDVKSKSEIIVTRGKYKGCNVADKVDIKRHFKWQFELIGWCAAALRTTVINKRKKNWSPKYIGTDVVLLKKLLEKAKVMQW